MHVACATQNAYNNIIIPVSDPTPVNHIIYYAYVYCTYA